MPKSISKTDCDKRLAFFAIAGPILIYLLARSYQSGDNAAGQMLGMTEGYAKNGYEYYEKNKGVMVFFYADWCGHCQKAKPEMAKFEAKYAEHARLENCTEGSTALAWDVKSFPTYRYYTNEALSRDPGSTFVTYKGGRDFDSLEQFFMSAK
jgi:thiol-disulfide isomerase/thioredoxin